MRCRGVYIQIINPNIDYFNNASLNVNNCKTQNEVECFD